MKRLFDLSVSILALMLLFPVLIVTAVLIRWRLGSPVLFKQQRPGLYGRPFYLYKFRTMTEDRDTIGNLLPDRERLTAFGKFLRAYSLDEFPQLINVIKGDISLVGPRPLLMEYLQLYSEDQAKRHLVKPGITGWAQVNGRNELAWEKKFELDVWYVEHQSFLLDLKIIWMTVFKVLRSEGVAQKNHATVEKFSGSKL
ncbi:sugar transferase [Ferviditalea candida]|uniref:Sugar transferase n=1 Tax=Ferviditalea candida TaxID=3108399 RepID=A0ABU5ZGK3_9BACL|nr:sugar transferase [Paenibacillaceae bacterium T2]